MYILIKKKGASDDVPFFSQVARRGVEPLIFRMKT